jgi:hypothetical protein
MHAKDVILIVVVSSVIATLVTRGTIWLFEKLSYIHTIRTLYPDCFKLENQRNSNAPRK